MPQNVHSLQVTSISSILKAKSHLNVGLADGATCSGGSSRWLPCNLAVSFEKLSHLPSKNDVFASLGYFSLVIHRASLPHNPRGAMGCSWALERRKCSLGAC